jgi:filamentous hemagglutinin family protein
MTTKQRLMNSACLAAVACVLASAAAQANPTGGVVASGGATITAPNGKTVDINQSTGQAVINWQSFGIAKGETVDFIQPTVTSVTLNRVTGNDLSSIFGTLTANGIVMLVNPNGVVFGRGSHVDVGGLVATTADIKDSDFLAGNYNFSQASRNANAAVVNAGDITIKDSGLAALVAPSVRNSGVISAKLGRVGLGGAKTFAVDFQGDGLLSFDASSVVTEVPLRANGKAVKALVVNTGRISADGGTVALSARAVKGVIDHAINTSGVIAATSVGAVDGKIVLSGGDDGIVDVAGKIDASGKGADETGGTVVATGADIDVEHGARITASGAAGGGAIAIGSDGTGTGSWSNSVSIGKGAVLAANAIVDGNGGKVSVLADKRTNFAGKISAHGGAKGGDGGTAEVSSHADVRLTGKVYLTAAAGKTGTFLLDPATLEITDDDSAVNSDNVVSRGWLESQSGDASIDLQASGLITVDAMAGHLINLATTSGNSFSLTSTDSGGITFIDPATEIRTQGGSIYLSALGAGSTITNVGKLTTNGGDVALFADGDITLANTVDAGYGSVSLQSNSGSIVALNGAAKVAGAYLDLSAGGSVGSLAAPLATSTTQLVVQSGGDIVVANDQVLTDLEIADSHAVPGTANALSITAPSLTFAASDDGSQYTLATVASSALQVFAFTGDQGIVAGHIETDSVNGTVYLSANSGDITGTGNSGDTITAGTVFLTASLGSIGSAAAPVSTNTPQLIVQTAGNLYLANGQALTDLDITSSHTNPGDVFAFQVTAPDLAFDVTDGTDGYHLNTVTADNGTTFNFAGDRAIIVGAINVGPAGSVSLSNYGDSGSITGDGSAPVALQAGSIALYTADAIGSGAAPLTLIASDVTASANNGGVYVSVPSASGTATSLDYIYAAGPVVVNAAQGDLISQRIYATAGDVTLTASVGTVTNAGYISATAGDGSAGNITLAGFGPTVTATGSLGTESIEIFNPGGTVGVGLGVGGTSGVGGAVSGVGTVVLAQGKGVLPIATDMGDQTANPQLTAAALGQTVGKISDGTGIAPEADAGLLELRDYAKPFCGGATTVAGGSGGTIILTSDGSVAKTTACRLESNLGGTGSGQLLARQ